MWISTDVLLLRHHALCCQQTNELPDWLVTSTLWCIPFHHIMSDNEGIISDILTVYWFLISLPSSSTEIILQRTIHLLCWWIVYCSEQWLMCMFICTFTNLNTNACDQKELMFKIFLSHLQSHLQLLILNINIVAMTCIAHSHIYVSVKGVSIAVNEIFVHIDTHLSNRWICASAMARIPQFMDFIPAKT